MKNIKLLLYILCVIVFAGKAQTQYTLNLTGNVSSGTYTNTAANVNADYITSNQQINGTANITNLASKEIQLTDGFAATSPFFDARIDGIDVADMSKNNHPWNPKKYERFEIGVQVMPNIQSQIDAFLNSGNAGAGKLNPYDPEQIKIKAEFTHSSSTYVRYGFYYKEYKQSGNADWMYQSNPYSFRVRLAPPATGVWTFTIHLIVNNVDISQFQGSFTVQSGSDNNGFLIINNNLRRFQFQESGNVFFGIGQAVGYADVDEIHKPGDYPYNVTPYSYNQQRSYINDLAANSGNFVRIRLDPWSNPVESRDIHIFASDNPTLTLTLSQCINNYDHNQRHMGEFDSTLALCENRGIYIMLNLLNDGYYNTANSDGMPAWNNNPYSALLGNNVAGIHSFFSNATAMNYYRKFLFYVQARWGYSPHIALWEHVNETENIDSGGGTHPYNTDAGFRADVHNWICSMKSYFQNGDNGQTFYPYHPHTSGLTGAYDPPCLDVYSQNDYSFAQHANTGRNTVAENYWYNNKAYLYGEVGIGCTYHEQNGDRDFHNAAWAGTFSGALTTALIFDDWTQIYNIPHRQNFKGLKAFTDLIDFNQTLSPSHTVIYGNNSWEHVGYDFRLNSISGTTVAYGWAQNASHYWYSDANVIDTLNFIYYDYINANNPQGKRGYCNFSPYYTYPLSTQACNNVYNFPISFNQMPNGHYHIDYYNTQTGAYMSSNAIIYPGGALPLTFYYSFDCGTNADVAYIVSKNWGFRTTSTDTTGGDTLYVKADTVRYKPMRVVAEPPRKNNVAVMKNQIKVYPNPAQDFVRIVNESGTPIDKIKLFNLVGDEVPVILSNNQSIDISQLAAGAYLLHINCSNYESVFKIIKVY